jgi:hypothetical protein
LANALKEAGSDRFALADDLARLLVSHAFLGELDVNPVVGVNGSKCDLKQCEFWARRIEGAKEDPVRVRIEGKSEARGLQSGNERGFGGRLWQHEVKLTWEGIIEMKKDRISRLLLVARGSEKLNWGNGRRELPGQPGVILSWAARAPDLSCGVRYGIIGEPIPAEETSDAQGAPQEFPDEARKQLVEALGGGPFLVFRDKVQVELKLTDDQKQKLMEQCSDHFQETRKVFEKINDLKPEQREKEMQSHRQNARKKLSVLLMQTLKSEQLERLRQIVLQQEGAFALGQDELVKALKITDEQRQQFVAITQGFQKAVQPLIKEAQSGGNPEEIRPKMIKIRDDCARKLEAVLTVEQNKQWKDILGKLFDVGD